jgi:hypothetical protein
LLIRSLHKSEIPPGPGCQLMHKRAGKVSEASRSPAFFDIVYETDELGEKG